MNTPIEFDKIEIPFSWTCLECKHTQTDTVNPVLGPFVTTTCGNCNRSFDYDALSAKDAASFERAVSEAEEIGGRMEVAR